MPFKCLEASYDKDNDKIICDECSDSDNRELSNDCNCKEGYINNRNLPLCKSIKINKKQPVIK